MTFAKFARTRCAAIVLLCYLGFSAVVGAVPMLLNPHGEPWQMPQSFLEHSPFHSFLIPGIVLLFVNGFLSLYVLALTLRRSYGYGWWIAVQGCVLLGWLAIECAILRLAIWPHYLFGVIALLLVCSGIALRTDTKVRTDVKSVQ